MRIGAVAMAMLVAVLAVAAPVAAGTRPGGKHAPALRLPDKDLWDFVRARANEGGWYPVPEFLRDRRATVPAGSPQVARRRSGVGIAYPVARKMLIKQGFLPVKIVSHGGSEAEDAGVICGEGRYLCRVYPELMRCSGAGFPFCNLLYQDQATEKYWIISIAGGGDLPPDVDFRQWRCCGYRHATRDYLYDMVIVRPDGRRVRFPREPRPPAWQAPNWSPPHRR